MFTSVIPVVKNDTKETVAHHVFLGLTPEIIVLLCAGKIQSVNLKDLAAQANDEDLNLPDMDIVVMFAPTQEHLVTLMQDVGKEFGLEVEIHEPPA